MMMHRDPEGVVAGKWRRSASGNSRVGSSTDVFLQSLRDRLAITPRQDGPWRRVAAAYRSSALPNREACLEVGQSQISLDHIFGARDERLAKLSMMRFAVRQLYAVLNQEQRQTADRVLPLCCLVGLNKSTH